MYYNYTPQIFLLFLKIFQLPSQYFHAFKVGRPESYALLIIGPLYFLDYQAFFHALH